MRNFLVFVIAFTIQIIGICSDRTFYQVDEQHGSQVPLHNHAESYINPATHRRLIGKLLVTIKELKSLKSENSDTVISRPELLAVRDALFDEQYKPWGAASLPSQSHNQVILDKVDDELFTGHSERHSYDERRSRKEDDGIQSKN